MNSLCPLYMKVVNHREIIRMVQVAVGVKYHFVSIDSKLKNIKEEYERICARKEIIEETLHATTIIVAVIRYI